MEYLLNEKEYQALCDKAPDQHKRIVEIFMQVYFTATETKCMEGKSYCDGCAFSGGIGFWEGSDLQVRLDKLGLNHDDWRMIECPHSQYFSK